MWDRGISFSAMPSIYRLYKPMAIAKQPAFLNQFNNPRLTPAYFTKSPRWNLHPGQRINGNL